MGSGLFWHVTTEEAEERLNKSIGQLQGELDSMNGKATQLETQIEGLKTKLYAKFGDSINLEP